MNSTTYIARAAATRREVSQTATDFVDAVRGVQIIGGMDSMDASAYTLGYLESFMVGVISDLPAKYRDQIISEMRRVTMDKLNNTKELA